MNQKLKIGVIARTQSNTVENELAGEVTRRGHIFERIVFDTVEITQMKKMFDDAKLVDFDILYYRTSLGPVWARALQRYLEKHNCRAINLRAVESPFLSDKTLQTMLAATEGFRTPKTLLAASNDYNALVLALGTPFVAKANSGSQGNEVYLIHSKQEHKSLIDERVHSNYQFQEYIPHDYDCRIHLIGGKPIAGYRRVPVVNDFRCNVSQGAAMKPLSEEDVEVLYPLAEQISDLFTLEIHVVDFLRSEEDGKYYFVEINDNPGWEISDKEATGEDMSRLVVNYFEKIATEDKQVDTHSAADNTSSRIID